MTMHTLLLGLALLVATTVHPQLAKNDAHGKAARKQDRKGSAQAADPNLVVAKAHGGKVWVMVSSPPSVEGEDLNKWLASHPASAEVDKKPSDERWAINYIAVFKKAPARGPMTIEFVDKKDPGTLVDQYSSQPQDGMVVFQEPYDLDTNNGFNKGHTYLIKVGQILKGKFVSYATGEVTLK
jgi:hypothetical protein